MFIEEDETIMKIKGYLQGVSYILLGTTVLWFARRKYKKNKNKLMASNFATNVRSKIKSGLEKIEDLL